MTQVGLVQTDSKVGNFAYNTDRILRGVKQAVTEGAKVVVLPEMSLVGYPAEDLVLDQGFRDASEVAFEKLVVKLQSVLSDEVVVVGHLGTGESGLPTNRASIISKSGVIATYDKVLLPTYGVFDEARVFAAGNVPVTFMHDGKRFGVSVCEDIWKDNLVTDAAYQECDILVVLNGSPFEKGKRGIRHKIARQKAQDLNADLVYVNLVGGQDDIVFDGASFVVSAQGDLVFEMPAFTNEVAVWNSSQDRTAVESHLDSNGLEETYKALVVGLRDYIRNNGFTSVVLGVSGGIDSALVAAIAADAVGGHNVFGISMPSRYSSDHSKDDAEQLMLNIGGHYSITPIEDMFAAFQGQLALTGVSEENLQARIRGVILMADSNMYGRLVLATGNKTELAVGYSTIYGDAVGGFAPLKDVPKTMVWDLSEWRNANNHLFGTTVSPIPVNSITKPPSAELRPGQVDQQSLPDYPVLDAFLEDFIENRVSVPTLSAKYGEQLTQKIVRLVNISEWKRRQYPPGIKITRLAFGKDRRVPITHDWTK